MGIPFEINEVFSFIKFKLGNLNTSRLGFEEVDWDINMIIAPPGLSQAGWNISHITSTCNLLRFLCSECKGQMGQLKVAEICLESCIRRYQKNILYLVMQTLYLNERFKSVENKRILFLAESLMRRLTSLKCFQV